MLAGSKEGKRTRNSQEKRRKRKKLCVQIGDKERIVGGLIVEEMREG